MHLDHVGETDAGRRKRLTDRGMAADQDGPAEARIVEGVGGTGDLRLLAFGKDDALGLVPHLGEDAVQPAGHGI